MPLNSPVYRSFDNATLDAEYNARESVASFDAEYALYVAESERVKREYPILPDIVYGAQSGETLDFYPAAPDAPIFLWIHGGYGEHRQRMTMPLSFPG